MAKEVIVIRHAEKLRREERSLELLPLTDAGYKMARKLRKRFRDVQVVIASPRNRAIETAKEAAGREPRIDERAGFTELTPQQKKDFRTAERHLAAQVIVENPDYNDFANMYGMLLVALIKEVLAELPEDGRALIVSHSIPMFGAERIVKGSDGDKIKRLFGYLEGFIVDEKMQMRAFNTNRLNRMKRYFQRLPRFAARKLGIQWTE